MTNPNPIGAIEKLVDDWHLFEPDETAAKSNFVAAIQTLLDKQIYDVLDELYHMPGNLIPVWEALIKKRHEYALKSKAERKV